MGGVEEVKEGKEGKEIEGSERMEKGRRQRGRRKYIKKAQEKKRDMVTFVISRSGIRLYLCRQLRTLII